MAAPRRLPSPPTAPHVRRVLLPWLTGVIVCVVVAAFILIQGGVLSTIGALIGHSPDSEPTSSVVSSDPGPGTQSDVPTPTGPVFSRPDAMRGVWVCRGIDYARHTNDTEADIRAQIDALLDRVQDWQFNTLLIPLSAAPSGFDATAYVLQEGGKRGLYCYGVLDLGLNTVENGSPDPATDEGLQQLIAKADALAAAYRADGYFLCHTGYAYGHPGSRDLYDSLPDADRATQSFAQFLQERVTAAVSGVVAALKSRSIDLYVGLLADSVWAHDTSRPEGSATANVYESLVDGYADTRTWIRQGLFDCVMVENYRSTTNGSASFGTVLDWWAALCGEATCPLYLSHAADADCQIGDGWESFDQLAQQVLLCQKALYWQGSVFRSADGLTRDPDDLTAALLRAFEKTLDEQYITRQLTITSPEKTSQTTTESVLSFRGSADPNFPLTLNGEEVALTDHGFFSLDLALSAGKNEFIFAHKGQTVTYEATYDPVILRSVAPAKDLSLSGGTTITISAIARKNATVSAKVGDTQVEMKAAPLQVEEDEQEDTDFMNFSGEYTLPERAAEQDLLLGRITVTARADGLTETKTGGDLYLLAPPKPTTLPTTQAPTAPTTAPTGDDPVPPDTPDPPSFVPGGTGDTVLATGRVVTINRTYAETFSGNTTDDWSRPVNAYLPYGTADVIVKNVYDSSTGSYYYLLGCGRRVYQSQVTLYREDGTLTANSLSSAGVSVSDGYTRLSLNSLWQIPYNVRLYPQSYGNEATQDYNITALTTQYIDITFYYTSSVSGLPDLSDNPLFRSAEWITDTSNQPVLRLYLRKTGTMRGYSVAWEKGKVVFSFLNPTGSAGGSQPLSGKRIVIDPGHGGSSIGTAGGSAVEKTLALQYGLLLRDKLEALGATVVMTRTTDILPDAGLSPASMDARTAYARNNGTDLFISIHMDSAASSARGFTVFYFNEYSQPYAKAVAGRIRTAYTGVGGQSNRAADSKWGNFHVMRLHDCPSILIECGFMSNPQDLELLISERYREAMTTAVANGMVDYFRSFPSEELANATVTAPVVTALCPDKSKMV